MAQTSSYEIANDSGAVVRGRLNEVFAAVQSSNSGASAPTDTAPGMLWLDTSVTPATLRQRNSANTEWVNIFPDEFALKPLCEPFPVWDHITGAPIPSNSGAAKYIRLTAGQSGAGGYNEGLLTDEQVSGSAPLVEADAEIATGPLAGQRVPLINTEGAFIRPGISSGDLQFDQMQRLTGTFGIRRSEAGGLSETTFNTSGAISNGGVGSSNVSRLSTTSPTDTVRLVNFNSADSPNARVSSTTSGETRPKNRQATYYMRIV